MAWLKLDTTIPAVTAGSVKEFNKWIEKYPANNEIILTKSNNISQETLYHLPAASVWQRGNHFEFHYIDGHQHIRVIYAIHYDEKSEMSPDRAWKAIAYFKGLLEVIPKDYDPIENPDGEKDTELFTCPENQSSKYYNYVDENYTEFKIHHCYSLDRNSSFLASLVNVYPQTRPWVDKFQADKLKIKSKPKEERSKSENELLQYDKIIVGWLNNPRMHRANAWKKVISDSNRTVHDLRMAIEKAGNTVLLVNTDAVKFIGEYPYNESTELGAFKYEWKDTDMYIKSVKSYGYLDNGKWKFKQAGECLLDKIKPRDEWTLEDFTNGPTDSQKHIVNINGKLEETYL